MLGLLSCKEGSFFWSRRELTRGEAGVRRFTSSGDCVCAEEEGRLCFLLAHLLGAYIAIVGTVIREWWSTPKVTIRLGSGCATMLQEHSTSHLLEVRLIFGKGFLEFVELLVGLDALQWIFYPFDAKATAAFLGTSCAT